MSASGYWRDLASPALAGLDPESTIALLPVAAVEQRGPHLPLATDAIICDGIVAAALARLVSQEANGECAAEAEATPDVRLLVLPTLEIGHSLEHAEFPGTLSADAETLLALWTQLARGVASTGLRRLMLFNTHGGQTALVDLAAVRWRAALGLLLVRELRATPLSTLAAR